VPTHQVGRIYDVPTQFGDIVVWSMRLTHSGNNRKPRLLTSIPLHPRVEMVWPALLTAPEQQRRISAFCAFGRPGSHLDRYVANLRKREADYLEYFRRARPVEEARPLLAGYGVGFRQPDERYGQLAG